MKTLLNKEIKIGDRLKWNEFIPILDPHPELSIG
jgi:hypothetical protein